MTIDYALPAGLIKPPWDASHFQVQRNGTRGYADTLPPCALIPDPHTDPVPGFSSLKPSKPFRKSVTVDGIKMTVPLDAYRMGEWLKGRDFLPSDLNNPEDARAFYLSANVLRDRDFERGHAIHRVAEAVLLGRPHNETNPDAQPYLPHLIAWLEANVTDVHALEAAIFGDGYGGTGDAWLNVRGVSAYVDWKSRGADSKHDIFEEEICQGGAYTSARYCILPSDDRTTAVRAPIPAATYGLVLSLKPDGVQEYWYDLAGAREAFYYMHKAYIATSDSGKVARKAKVKDPTPQIAVPPECMPASSGSQPGPGFDPSAPAGEPDPKALLEELKAYDVEVTLLPVIDPLNGQQHIDLTVKLPGKTKRSYGWAATDKGKADVLTRAIADVRRALKIPIGYTPTPSPTPSPSEGDAVDSVADIRGKYDALDETGRVWVNGLQAQATAAGLTFHLSTRTERRAHIMRGLVALATAGAGDDELAIILEPYAPSVGHLDHTTAKDFADACNRYVGTPIGADRVAELLGATVQEGAA